MLVVMGVNMFVVMGVNMFHAALSATRLHVFLVPFVMMFFVLLMEMFHGVAQVALMGAANVVIVVCQLSIRLSVDLGLL